MANVDLDRATCYHEAAHAVFALKVCGGAVRYVEVDEGYGAASLRAFGGPAENWRHALYTLAGSFAEQLEIWGEVRPESFEDILESAEIEAEDPEEERGDSSHLVRYLEGMGADSFEDLRDEYEEVVRETENEIRRLWPDIEVVAAALKERRLLGAGELEKLLKGAADA
ncbi:MAG TPA: hypothetical protein VNA27_15835 [Rubrobacteraceae bacterium]|nr:hypothetical protein [Rubrobacteraceae bacterium]